MKLQIGHRVTLKLQGSPW